MSILYFAYAIVAILVLVCILLAVINWVSLSSLSSKAAFLEDEIQKKALEFAALRKEMQNRERLAMEAQQTEAVQASDPESSRIEVVRSVRQGVDNPEVKLTQETIDMSHPAGSNADESRNRGVLETPPVSTATANEALRDASVILVPVYSSAKKDTDFQFVYKTLAEKLPVTQAPRVVLDFRNILFLYEKELAYLQRIKESIEQQQGTIIFVNCDTELRQNILAIPGLISCLAE